MNKAEIETLKTAHPILEVARALGLEVQNNRIRCLHPRNHAHGDRTPSVSLWPDKGSFRCWVCPDVRGDVIDLVRLARNCGFREALAFLGAEQAIAAPSGSRSHTPASTIPRNISVPSPTGYFHPGTPAPAVPTAYGSSVSPSPAAASPPNPAPAAIEASGQTNLISAPAFLPTGPAALAPSVLPLPQASLPPRSAFAPADLAQRLAILATLLDLSVPVQGAVARYLQKRRIFKRTWDNQRLRMVGDYGATGSALEARFGREILERAGFFNPSGHLRYYRHRLLFPYFDPKGHPVYMQARAIEPDAKPKELSMAGSIPLPYNVRLLNGEPGHIYLCEGVIDTLTLLEQGFPAVGVPGAANFKPAWVDLFRGKTVHVAFDPDLPGENGAARTIDLLTMGGIEARRLAPPQGLDLNDWLRRG